MAGSMEHLPEDLVAEIMSWLPPESLLRLKIVNKALYNLIDGLIKDEKFVAKHLRNSKSKASSLLFSAILADESGNTSHDRSSSVRGSLALSISGDDHSLGFAIENFDRMLFMPSGERAIVDWYRYTSHCNGIIAIFDTRSNMFVLLNPATRELKLLPDLCLPKDQYNKLIRVTTAIGYDPIDHVYKLLQILVPSSGAKRRRGKVRVCSDFGHNSWRKIKWPAHICNDVSDFCTRRELYAKGVYYWLAVALFDVDIRIRAFDMHAEEFYSVPLPDNFPSNEEIEGSENVVVEAIEWKESLALVYHSNTRWLLGKPIEIWTSIQGFNSSSKRFWTKTLSIEVGGEIFCCPVAFWKSDEFLMIDGDGHLVSYNLRTKKVVRNARVMKRLWVVGNYVKSLVSIKRLNTN